MNPRSRDPIKFQLIVASIAAIGLKRPITVSRHPIEPDGTQYDLVCGQGRMEAPKDKAELIRLTRQWVAYDWEV